MKEILEFNHKKKCVLWLILIGIVLIVAVRQSDCCYQERAKPHAAGFSE